MNPVEPNLDDVRGDGQADAPGVGSRPNAAPSTTIGTGSALGIGCVIAVVLFVVIALAARWLTGIW